MEGNVRGPVGGTTPACAWNDLGISREDLIPVTRPRFWNRVVTSDYQQCCPLDSNHLHLYSVKRGRVGVVGIFTLYGLDRSRVDSLWDRDFPHASWTILWLTQPPVQWVLGLFPGKKRPRPGVDHASSSRTQVKERLELYFYSFLGLRALL